MMLSGRDISEALGRGDLAVEPFSEASLRPSGIVLHLGEHLLRPLPGKTIDIKSNVLPDYKEIIISPEKPYELEPQGFVLGHTYEAVSVGTSLGFLIEGRSTLARIGLTIVQTAMLVYPGHRNRTITLEVANNGPNPILLYPKMKIARGAIFELKNPAESEYDDTGKYRKQQSVGKPIFKDEFLRD